MTNIKCYNVKGRECLKVKGMAHNIRECRDVQAEKYQDISVGFKDSKIVVGTGFSVTGDTSFSATPEVRYQ